MNVKGHMIIAPVQHFTDFFDIQENVLSLSMDKIKFLSNLCQQQLGAEGVNLLHAMVKFTNQFMKMVGAELAPKTPILLILCQ